MVAFPCYFKWNDPYFNVNNRMVYYIQVLTNYIRTLIVQMTVSSEQLAQRKSLLLDLQLFTTEELNRHVTYSGNRLLKHKDFGAIIGSGAPGLLLRKSNSTFNGQWFSCQIGTRTILYLWYIVLISKPSHSQRYQHIKSCRKKSKDLQVWASF